MVKASKRIEETIYNWKAKFGIFLISCHTYRHDIGFDQSIDPPTTEGWLCGRTCFYRVCTAENSQQLSAPGAHSSPWALLLTPAFTGWVSRRRPRDPAAGTFNHLIPPGWTGSRTWWQEVRDPDRGSNAAKGDLWSILLPWKPTNTSR